MSLTHITDHAGRAYARLAQNLRDSLTHQGILTVLSAQVQEIEDAFWGLRTTRQVDGSSGVQLDAIGEIVGRPRHGAGDDFYRQAIKAQALINRGSGTRGTFVAMLEALLPAGSYTITENPTANGDTSPNVTISITGVLVPDIGPYVDLFDEAKAAGLTILINYQGIPDDQAFTFDGGGGLGFGSDSDASVGGKFVGATR